MKNPLNIRLWAAAVRNLRTRTAILAVLAITASLSAFTVATALSGNDPLSAPADFVSAVATEVGLAPSTADQPTPFSNTTTAGNAPRLGSPEGGSSDSALTASDASPTTSPITDTAGASPTANDPHDNSQGCDDIIHAEGATPSAGGPVGCDVGNSHDVRQNGKHQATAASATADTTETASATATSATAESGARTDPHANLHGCDDIIHGTDATPGAHGGPVDCAVGNSGGHRQNGNGSETPPPDPASTATTGTAPSTAGNSGSNGNGNTNSNHGNSNSGHGSGGNGKNK